MAVKLVVLYPAPNDVEAFEHVYAIEHVPMVLNKITGLTRFVGNRIVGSPFGPAPFHRVAELHFASLDDLTAALSNAGGQETAAHAMKISSGGAPTVLIAEEHEYTLNQAS